MQSPGAEFFAMERLKLEKEIKRNGERRYFVFFNDSDLHQFHAYIVAPDTGVYRFKLVKLEIWLPCYFPDDPPKVRFIHNTMHFVLPNCLPRCDFFSSLYVDHGNVLWRSQDWKPREICHKMLLYIRQLLDYNPFKHEPLRGQDTLGLSRFVMYVTWEVLLLNYIDNETNINALAFLRDHVERHGEEMLRELWRQRDADPGREYFVDLFRARLPADYLGLAKKLEAVIERARLPPRSSSPRAGMPRFERELRDEAAWTWAGQVSLKWSRLFSRHRDQAF